MTCLKYQEPLLKSKMFLLNLKTSPKVGSQRGWKPKAQVTKMLTDNVMSNLYIAAVSHGEQVFRG